MSKFKGLSTFQKGGIQSPKYSENVSFLNSAELGSSSLQCEELLIRSGYTNAQIKVFDKSGTIKTSMLSSDPSENTQEILENIKSNIVALEQHQDIGERIMMQEAMQNRNLNQKLMEEKVRVIQQKLNSMRGSNTNSISINDEQQQFENDESKIHLEQYKLKKQESDEDFLKEIKQRFGPLEEQKIQTEVQEKLKQIDEIKSQKSSFISQEKIQRSLNHSRVNSMDLETKRTQRETNPTHPTVITQREQPQTMNQYKRETFQSVNFDPESTKDNRFITCSPREELLSPRQPEQKSIPVFNRASNLSVPKTPNTINSAGGKQNSTALNTMYFRPDTSKQIKSPSDIQIKSPTEMVDMFPESEQPFQFEENLSPEIVTQKFQLQEKPSPERVAQKFQLSIEKVDSMIQKQSARPQYSADLQEQMMQRKQLQKEIQKLQKQKGDLKNKETLLQENAELKADLKEKQFRIEYLEKISIEKDNEIRDLQMETLSIREKHDQILEEKLQQQSQLRIHDETQVEQMQKRDQEVKQQQLRIGQILREFFLDYESHSKSSTLKDQVDLLETHIAAMKNKEIKRKISKSKFTSIRGGIPKPVIDESISRIDQNNSSIMNSRFLKQNSSMGDFSFRGSKPTVNSLRGNSGPKKGAAIPVPPNYRRTQSYSSLR